MASTKRDLDQLDVHEVFDRTFLFAEFVSQYLAEHPALQGVPKAKRQIDQAVTLLYGASHEIRGHAGKK